MEAEEHYALPLNDLLMVLRASSGQTYQVRAEVPASLLHSSLRRAKCHAEVIIARGQVVACIIRDQANTLRMEGAPAFEAVRAHEQLIWIVTPYEQPAQALPSPAPAAPWAQPPATVPPFLAALVPWVGRPAPVKLQQTAELEDRRLRKVWLLIDGRRTVTELAALLQISPDAVSQALTSLETRGLIAPGRPEKR